MIPQRIQLSGFLCYKDEQEIDFDGNSTLWMLSGLNGSGKSSIFDAVTYALFGHHRGGSQHAVELINKDGDGLAVEFDFRLDERVYRVRRTLRRKARGAPASTQQIYRYEPNGNGKNPWVAIEGSHYKREFDDWIGKNIGLTYETFTSSVLLLQGQADKLLSSKAEDRRAVLASIVDLESYEQLHSLADEKRRKLKNKFDDFSDRLEALPGVKAEEVTAAEESIRTAEEAREQARSEFERSRELERQARAWMELQNKLAAARQRWQQAGQLLETAADIERDVERLRELREVLPRLREIVKQRGTIREADLGGKGLLQEKEKTAEQLARCGGALKQERDKRTTLQTRIEADEKQRQELEPLLRSAIAQMEKLTEYERQSAELMSIRNELERLPADAAEEVNRARTTCERLDALNRLLPQLFRFQEHRDGLRQALERERTAKQRLAQLEMRGKQLNAELKRLEPLVKEADRVTRQTKDQETEARTLLKQAQDSLREIAQMDGAKRCRHCGQELTPGHLLDEKRRREEDARQADERFKQTAADLQAARKEEQRLRDQESGTQKSYQEAREEYREAQSQANQGGDDMKRLQGDCIRAYDDLPDEHRQRIGPAPVADWLKTEYPTPHDLGQLRAEAAGYASARQRLRNVENVLTQWNKLKTQEAEKIANLERLQAGLPADREAVRRTHTDLGIRIETLDKELKVKRGQRKDAEAEIERWTRQREQEQERLNRIELQFKNKELERQHAEKAIAANQKALPSSWQAEAETVGAAEYSQWDKERSGLEAADIDRRGKDLLDARLNLEIYRRDKEKLEAEQDDFPAETRRDPADIKMELEQAKQTETLRDKDLTAARQQLARLEDNRKQRERIGEEAMRLEGEWKQQKRLADLLGKDHLQLYLVRRAEKQVVEFANAVLDRLSGGQLYLKLRDDINGEDNSTKALDLEAYNRGTGEKPINVAFLSGSQKFRVAVSLALGIGQCASHQQRPIQSVIIDEGFGCLDSQGRQVMIQELQNLRSQMRCILLVSHQEEFAEAFSDGYHFKLESGATKVERFQK